MQSTSPPPLRAGCRWCGAAIFWLLYPSTGKWAPIDQGINPAGNIIVDLEAQTYRIVSKEEHEATAAAGGRFHLNHWATCTKAADHRPRSAAAR